MDITRRSSLQGAALLLAAAAAGCGRNSESLAQGADNAPAVAEPGSLDEETLEFWSKSVREPAVLYSEGLAPKDPSISNPVFLYYSEQKGFRPTYDTELDPLPASGNMQVLLRVERFRPAVNDREQLGNLQQGSLRIDLQQTKPLPNLVEALAWSAVAAFLPEASGKLPPLQNLEFDPGVAWGRLQTVPIPDGLAFWSWNFFVQQKDSAWSKYFRLLKPIADVVVPFLGLPAIAVSALSQVDRLMGVIQATDKTKWLLKSTATPVYGTKAAGEEIGNSGIALRTGRYLILPRDRVSDFGKEVDKLKFMPEGLVVPKNTRDLDVYKASDEFMPDLRYLSVYVKATVSK
jgi:hypothetical protein